jgi:hypothetical protein
MINDIYCPKTIYLAKKSKEKEHIPRAPSVGESSKKKVIVQQPKRTWRWPHQAETCRKNNTCGILVSKQIV